MIWSVATVGILLMLATVWLLRRGRRRRPRAAALCVILSVGLHVLLLWVVPLVTRPAGGRPRASGTEPTPLAEISLSDIRTEPLADQSTAAAEAAAEPQTPAAPPLPLLAAADPASAPTPAPEAATAIMDLTPETIEAAPADAAEVPIDAGLDALLDQLLVAQAAAEFTPASDEPGTIEQTSAAQPAAANESAEEDQATTAVVAASASPMVPARVASARVAGQQPDAFSQRSGDARHAALRRHGGDQQTEAAVEAALRWLAYTQREDGSWDPLASGGGRERAPLGERRAGAGSRATTAITGLALLSMLGRGNTHLEGPYATNVHAGLSYLIRNQAPNGSLEGNATPLARTYCHGMATLALCEAAAMTQDPQAIAAARAAIAYTERQQHPTTGGWRYRRGETGDTSQLGWQALALHTAGRASIPLQPRTLPLVQDFLRSVRAGDHGGLARYRPGQPASRTMTAEAMAIRLLLSEAVPAAQLEEAERSMLEQLPGDGPANYYYWYYASLALRQRGGPGWETWNSHLKQELLRTQQPDGSWSTDSVWGGYGGRVYTTALAALSLEVYYRHR